ncbi:hypothetical protein GN316_15195 [Xylophilus sp. Kf1]|nr:hypothetical protein [Xylophilus sp. Kf1]
MTKIEKLCAAYEEFGRAIAAVPGERAKSLADSSADVRAFVAKALSNSPKPTPSQVAAGLEQGWRETPRLIQGIGVEWRSKVAEAWFTATSNNYPEFLTKEGDRLQMIVTRGKIRTEAEFYLVRHEIDVLEGQGDKAQVLPGLYKLADEYEKR